MSKIGSLTRRRNRRISRPVPGRPEARSTLDMLIWNHVKVWAAVIFGVAVVVLSPWHWSLICRVLMGWNGAILVLMPLTYIRMRHLDAKQLRAHYEEEDPTAPVILLVAVLAALLSVIAIVALLSTLRQVEPAIEAAHLLLATLTIVNSWLLVHTLFALHYADLVYSVELDQSPLSFPHTREPLFWDFIYFSFTLGVACQTADVATTQTGIRRTVIIHCVIAFLFNVSILGFAINVSAGMLGGN